MVMKKKILSQAIRAIVSGGLIAGMGLSTAYAQDQDESNAELERLSVTGSRIKRADIEQASPVFVVQREDIERTGLTSVGDLLQDLPIAGSALNTNFNNGGNGETRLDLRNLGSNRLLVLLNGRRLVTNLGGVVDLNNIPVAVIKRIEILKDGASSVYGSDAISGVVNVITRDDFEGLQSNVQFGQYESENDGEIQAYDFSVGTSSDRGSVFFSASYVKNEPVFAGDRVISSEPQFGTGNAFGSAGTPQGTFLVNGSFLTTDPGSNITGPGGQGAAGFRNSDILSANPVDAFNFAPDNYLLAPLERTNVFTQGTYDVTDDIRMTVEASFNQRSSDQLLAPTPLFLGAFAAPFASTIGVSADNPFNPFGQDLAASSWFLGRRLIEADNRFFSQEVDSYRFGAGLEGSFELADRYFDWDMNYVYGKINRNDIAEGRVNLQRVADSLSAGCVDGSIAGCVPLNVFGGQGPDGSGTITPAMLNYILYTEQSTRGNELRNYTANVTGELFEIPAGPVGFAVGYEYRQVEGFDTPDALVSSGITSGTARQPTSGATTVDEFYVEFAVPLLSGVSGAERLDLSLSARHSDYDTFGDTVNTKIGLEWQPIDDLLLRATFSEGFRAPNIAELFAGQSDSFPTLVDPCNGLDTDGDGFPDTTPNLPGCSGVPGSYSQPNPQIRITVGSNPLLTPETSDSKTFGLVYSPSWLDGLDMTIDYYNIELDNAISAVGAQTILNACARTEQLCGLLTRSSTGFVSDILAATANINTREVEGVDFLVSYSFPETDWGFFRVVWDGAYQGRNEQTTPDFGNTDPNATPISTNFLGLNLGDTGLPRWKSSLDLNWSYGDWDATWGMQFIGDSDEICGIAGSFGFCNIGTDTTGDGFNDTGISDLDQDGDIDGNDLGRHLGSTIYHDAQVSYHMSEYDTRLTFGVQNIFDKGPPLSTQAFANSFNASDYRVPGRFPYVRVTVDF